MHGIYRTKPISYLNKYKLLNIHQLMIVILVLYTWGQYKQNNIENNGILIDGKNQFV